MARACPHCGAHHPQSELRCSATGLPIGGDPRLVGTTVAGRYHLVRLLGDGGMGAVYKAADKVLRRFVAIKLLHPAVASNPKSVERFQREARSAASIGHPNIIDILDFGYTNDAPFLVMEYLRGRSLAHAIGTEGALEIERACKIATHTLAGLAAAHDRGILHRDLKPANLMLIAHLGDKDFVKLCDFGFAALLTPQRRIDDEGKVLTPARTLVGTPAYAAPERLRGDDRRDPRIDVYSVGVLLFEMLAGMRPFDAPTFAELARKVRNQPPPSVRALRRDCPPALDRVIQRALAKEADERWDNAETFAAALVPFGGRIIAVDEDMPSDSFTMDLLKIRARETLFRRTGSHNKGIAAPDLHTTDRNQAQGLVHGEPSATERTDRSPALSDQQARRALRRSMKEEPKRDTSSLEIPIEVGSSDHSALVDTGTSTFQRLRRSDIPSPTLQQLKGATPVPPPSFSPLAGKQAPPTAPPAPQAATEAEPTSQERAFEGRVAVAVLRFVARKYGERALTTLLTELPEEIRPVFTDGVAPDSWVPFEAVTGLFETIDATLGNDDLHVILECGRAAAEGELERVTEIQPPDGPTPELLVAEVPSTMQSLVRGIDFKVRRVGKGYGRLEADEHGPPSLAYCVSTLGFLDRLLRHFGGEEVEVNLLSCRALGDPQCQFDLSWLS